MKGYAGKILRVDLSSGTIEEISTDRYATQFVGGRGIGAKIHWDEVPPETKASDPENRLVFATGPLCGLPVIGGSRWQVSGKSSYPSPQQFCYCNLGGTWGAELKFAGYDALVLQGTSDIPRYLLLHDGTVELADASHLWGKGAIETREALKGELGRSVKVVTIGPAGENRAVMATLLADKDAVGSGGVGAVMGSKQLKAIAVGGQRSKLNVAHPQRLQELTKYYRELGRGLWEFLSRWSRDPIDFKLIPGQEMMKKDPCYGCQGKCPRKLYETADGRKAKFVCHSALFYQPWTEVYYGDWKEVAFHATKLCDTYGLDTKAIDLIISWLNGCYEAGVLTEKDTGLPLSRIGSEEFIETLIRRIGLREGFGDLLAQGLERAAQAVGAEAEEQVRLVGHFREPGCDIYGPRLYNTHALMYAIEPRLPIQQLHEIGLIIAKWQAWARGFPIGLSSENVRAIAERCWGGAEAADFSTYEGKALAAKLIQDRQYAKECLVLCDWLWPITDLDSAEDRLGDPSLESKLYSAVTGEEVDEVGLYRSGERVFNLQRAISVREGHRGREFDTLPDRCFTLGQQYDVSNSECLVPGRDGEVVSRKGAVVDREAFERMKDEYYQLRGWDVATGLQTREGLAELDLQDVSQDLERRRLLAP
jgi:aldehyde:ferredoxin oxidoreductase